MGQHWADFEIERQSVTCDSHWRLVGDPIDVVTGANIDVVSDFRLQGPLPFRWQRYYTSARNDTSRALGWGHTHGFDRTLTQDLDGVRYKDPSGKEICFPHLGLGLTAMESGVVIRRNSPAIFQIAEAGQPVQVFEFTSQSETARLQQLRLKSLQVDAQINLYYNSDGGLTEIVDSLRRSITVESDSQGRIRALFMADNAAPFKRRTLILYEYDPAGNIVTARDYYNATLSFNWDRGNRMTRRTDRLGYSFHFEYDNEGRCVHSRGDDGLFEVALLYQPDVKKTVVRRGDGGEWIYGYDNNHNVTEVTDPYGHLTKVILNKSGRPVQEIDPNGNATNLNYDWREAHDYRIDANGNILPTKSANPKPPDPLAPVHPNLPFEWDFGHRMDPKAFTSLDVDDPLLTHFPNALTKALFVKATKMPPLEIISEAQSRPPDLSYSDNTIIERTPIMQSLTHDANGNLIARRDRDGAQYRFVYRSWNALSQSVDPLGHATSFELTVQGLMAKVTDPGGTVTEYSYDLKEDLVAVREVGQLVETYRRDPAGNVIEKTDSSGRVLVNWIIGLGNLDKVRTLASGETHVFEHDARGRIAKTQTPAGTTTFSYDDLGNLLSDQRDGRGVVHEFDFHYLVATTFFHKFVVRYKALNDREISIEDPAGGQHQLLFSPSGLIAKLFANGSRELSRFDSNGQCRFKALARNTDSSDPWIRRYEFSAAGDLVSIDDLKWGTTGYRYDAAHRLVEEVTPQNNRRSFEIDPAGNLLLQPGLSGVVIGDGNRLREANGDLFTYNKRLNISVREGSSGTIHYLYDDLDVLTGCDINGEPWRAEYDGLGRRTHKIWKDQTTTFYFDDFRLAAEIRNDNSCRLYIYVDEIALSPFLFIEYTNISEDPASGRRFYIFTNQVGAPIRVDDDNGVTVWSARIDPYGKTAVDVASTIELNLRFPGHYFDQETNLHYNRFRYFSPELGRYLQSDPAGLAGGINAYGYPHRPLTSVDVDGLGKNGAKAPKTKDGPHPSVGCHAPIDPNLSPEQVKAELKAKADKLLAEIKAEQAKNAQREKDGKPPVTHVTAPDGTLLQISPHPQPGPCLSVAYDSKTGKTYYGQNTEKIPDPMHRILAANASEASAMNKENFQKVKPPGMYPMVGVPGDHSEVNAVNKGMVERQNDPKADPPHPKDYSVYNVNTNGQKQKEGEGKPCCPNCQRVLDGPNAQRTPDGKSWVPDPDGGVSDVSR